MPPKFKPGGKRFPPKVISKPLPPQAQRGSRHEASSSGLDEEAENKFELELCWCIQQLELGINSGKLADKQLRDTKKSLNLLKSNNVALVQKRQIMRTTFGDYRAKMQQEEKKHGNTASTVKFSAPKLNDNKSVFLRKAQSSSDTHESSENGCNNDSEDSKTSKTILSSLFSKNVVNEPFTFNFSQPEL